MVALHNSEEKPSIIKGSWHFRGLHYSLSPKLLRVMRTSRKKNVHDWLFLLSFVKAVWFCLASIVMVSIDKSSNAEHLWEWTCSSKENVFPLLQYPIPAAIMMHSHSRATGSHPSGELPPEAQLQQTLQCAGSTRASRGRPVHPTSPESLAAHTLQWKFY